MKAVLMSIQPKWCELIASGKKTVEVRKTKPKIETPFKCYIYETQGRTETPWVDEDGHEIFKGRGQVIGEFVCDKICDIKAYYNLHTFYNRYKCHWIYGKDDACLSFDEMDSYLKGNNGHGWHISDLVIYDKPKKLGEFKRACPDEVHSCAMCRHSDYTGMRCTPIIRPPQSWCYVEEVSEL